MFSRFLTNQGTLFVQTQCIVDIYDSADGTCYVHYLTGDDVLTRQVDGSAQENFDRLKAEELEMIGAAAERQQRVDRGLPLLPIPRGKVARP